MTGQAWWAFLDSKHHAELLAAGWEESRLRRCIPGSGVVVLMVKEDSLEEAATGPAGRSGPHECNLARVDDVADVRITS